MVKENMGISILPYFSIAEEIKSGKLMTTTVSGLPTISRGFDLIFSPQTDFNEATRTFVDFLKKTLYSC